MFPFIKIISMYLKSDFICNGTHVAIVIYVPVLCALCSVMGYYGLTVLIVGRKKPVFEGLRSEAKQARGLNLKIEGSQKQVEGAQRLEQRAVSLITEHGAHKTGT